MSNDLSPARQLYKLGAILDCPNTLEIYQFPDFLLFFCFFLLIFLIFCLVSFGIFGLFFYILVSWPFISPVPRGSKYRSSLE